MCFEPFHSQTTTKCVIPPTPHSNLRRRRIALSICPMKKLRHREAKKLVQDHTAGHLQPDLSLTPFHRSARLPRRKALCPCSVLPGTWAVGLPWLQGTPDSKDVLEACLARQRLPQYRLETSLKRIEAASPVTGSWVRRTSQRKALLPLHIKRPFSATHTGTDTHRAEPQRVGQ